MDSLDRRVATTLTVLAAEYQAGRLDSLDFAVIGAVLVSRGQLAQEPAELGRVIEMPVAVVESILAKFHRLPDPPAESDGEQYTGLYL